MTSQTQRPYNVMNYVQGKRNSKRPVSSSNDSTEGTSNSYLAEHALLGIKRKRTQDMAMTSTPCAIKEEAVDETDDEAFSAMLSKNVQIKAEVEPFTDFKTPDNPTGLYDNVVLSNGFTRNWIDPMDNRSEYVSRTQMDNLKKNDNIVFTNLVREDHANLAKSITSCKFVKAPQGRFFYTNKSTTVCASDAASKIVVCSTPYVYKIVRA